MTKIASVLILLILIVSIGFGIYLSQQNQNLKSRADANPSVQAYCQGVHDNLRVRINWSGLPALESGQYYDIRTYDNSGDADAGQDSRNGRNTTVNSEGSTFVTVVNEPNNTQLVAAHRRPYQVLIKKLGSGGSDIPIADSGVFSCKADPSDVRIDDLAGGGPSCGVISGQARVKLNAYTDFSPFANNQIHLWLIKGACGLGNNSSCNPQGYNSNLSEDTMVKILTTDGFGRFSYDLKNDPSVASLFANNVNRTIALYGVGVADAEFWNNFYYNQINVSGCSATTPVVTDPLSINVTQNNGQVTVNWTGPANGVWITDQAVANIGGNALWCGSCRNILTTRQTDTADAPNLAGNSFSFGADLAGFRVEGTSRTDIGKYNLVNGKKYTVMVSNGGQLSNNVEFTYQSATTPTIQVTQNNGQVTVNWTGTANGVWITDQAVANIGGNALWCGSCRNILTTRQTDTADAPNLAGNSYSFGSDLAGFRVEGTSRTDIGKYSLVNGKKYTVMVSNGGQLSSNVEFTYQSATTPTIQVTQNNGQVTVNWTGQANGVWITDQAVANIGGATASWCGSCRNILTTRQTNAENSPNLSGNTFTFGADLVGFRDEGRTDIGKYSLVNGKKYWIMVSNGGLRSNDVEFTYQAPVTTPPVGEPNPNPPSNPNPPTNPEPQPPAPVNTKATGNAQIQGCLLSGAMSDSNYVNNETGKLLADLWVSGTYYVKDSSNKCVASNSLYLGYAEAKSVANSSGNYSFDFANITSYAPVTSGNDQNGKTYKNSTCTDVAYPQQEIIKKGPKDVTAYFIDLGPDGKRVDDPTGKTHNAQTIQVSCDPDKDVKPLFVRFTENEDDLKQFSQNKCNLDINQVVTNKVAPEAYIANGCPPLNDISTGIAKVSEYKFKNQSAGLKTIYAEFIYSNGKTVQKKSSIEAVAPDPKITNLTCGKDLTGRGLSLTIKGNNFLAKNTQSQIKVNNATANITNWSNPNGGVQTVTATYEDSKLTPEQGQQYNVTLTRADGRTDTASCLVGVSQLSLGAKVWCRQPSKYDQDNVEVVIAEAITGGKRIETKVKIDKDGNLQGINNQLKAGACYRMSIKAPKSVRRVIEFQAQEGSTIIPDFRLPIGDIYPDGGGDGKINASDRSEIIRQWSALRSSSSSGSLVKTGDLNIDTVINSFDFSCMMYDYNEGDAPKAEAGPIDGAKNPALKQSCDESFNQNNYNTNNATGSGTIN